VSADGDVGQTFGAYQLDQAAARPTADVDTDSDSSLWPVMSLLIVVVVFAAVAFLLVVHHYRYDTYVHACVGYARQVSIGDK